jgi:Flp pilus assembly protein TadD
MYREGIAQIERALVISPDNMMALSALGYADAAAGRRAEAERLLNQLAELSKRKYVPAGYRAIIYVGLGERDKAFEWLEKAYDERSIHTVGSLKVTALYDPLRSDPRFQDLLRRTNLQP